MYNLRAFAEPSQVDDVVAALAALPEVCHVVLEGHTADGGKTLVTAEVEAASVDEAFAVLRGAGLSAADLSVHHVDYAHPVEREEIAEGVREHDGALVWAEVADAAVENVGLRPAYLVYGAVDEKAGAAGTLFNVCQDPRLNHCLEITSGVLAADSVALLREFFQARR